MTARFLIVKTAMETKCRQPGGKRIKQALVDAGTNLDALAPEMLRLIDAGLEEISLILAEAGDARPADANLLQILNLADALSGYCATVRLPGLDKALIRLCQLADAVLHADYWRSDTFGPTLIVLRLTRHQSLTQAELDLLFNGIDQCTEKYVSHRTMDYSQGETVSEH